MGSACLSTDKRILILEPNELHFGGPRLRPTITLVTLKNPNDFDVMYKFKTTAPRIYRVRPNLGIVASHGDKTVRIVLMPFSFEIKERLVHKFMVLTAPAPDDCSDLRKIWSALDEGKMRCEKFKSIIEMGRQLAPITLEVCSSSTSAEYEQDFVGSCAGDTSQSEDNFHFKNNTNNDHKKENHAQPVDVATSTTGGVLLAPKAIATATVATSTPSLTPRLDKEAILAELRAENNKLRDLNDVLRRENRQLTFELERFRDVKMEVEGSIVLMNGSLVNGGETKHNSNAIAEAATAAAAAATTTVTAAAADTSNDAGGKTNKIMLFLATSMTMAIVCAMIGKFVFPEKISLEGFQNFLDSVVN